MCIFKDFCCAILRYFVVQKIGTGTSRKLYNVPGLPTEGSLQNGDECRKAICKKCIIPIKTSLGQLTPFRRRGHLFFFSLAKAQRNLTALCLPTAGRSLVSCLSAGGLCVSASLRDLFFFFFFALRKVTRLLPTYGRQATSLMSNAKG